MTVGCVMDLQEVERAAAGAVSATTKPSPLETKSISPWQISSVASISAPIDVKIRAAFGKKKH